MEKDKAKGETTPQQAGYEPHKRGSYPERLNLTVGEDHAILIDTKIVL